MFIELLRMAQFFLFPTVQNFKRLLSLPFFRIFLPCYDFPFFLPSSFSVFQSPFPPSFFPFLWIPVLVSFAHLLHLSCISSSFPLCIRPWPRPPNARVNIIMCMPFLCSSYIREKHVLQHPYDSTLQLLSSKIIQKKSDLSLEYI